MKKTGATKCAANKYTLRSKSLTWNIYTFSSGCNVLTFYVLYVYTPQVKMFVHLYRLRMFIHSESRFFCQSVASCSIYSNIAEKAKCYSIRDPKGAEWKRKILTPPYTFYFGDPRALDIFVDPQQFFSRTSATFFSILPPSGSQME